MPLATPRHLWRRPPGRRAPRTAALGLALAICLSGVPAAARNGAEGARGARSAAKGLGNPYDELTRLGEWVSVRRHGKAWRPHGVDPDWRPYFHGSWTWTVDGWFWVSEEPWGSLTYHYGRWLFEPAHGWVWLPGTAWAPAWVAWRSSREYIGWAPLPPEGTPHPAFWTFLPASPFVGQRVAEASLPAVRGPALLLRTRPSGAPPPAATVRSGAGARPPLAIARPGASGA